jgi:hypothetical protein
MFALLSMEATMAPISVFAFCILFKKLSNPFF